MEPYKLLLKLRDNKILFSYMETVAVYVEDDTWTIIGDSDDGELRVSLTESNVLRVALPIAIPSKLPLQVLEDVLTKMEPDFDGLLKAELDPQFDNFVLYYYIHVAVVDYEKDLDRALIRFQQDKRNIIKVFSDLTRSINNFKGNFIDGMKKLGLESPPESKPKGSSLWDEINEIDKKFDKDSEEDTEEDTES